MSSSNLLLNLQGHQLVIQQELNEINNDLNMLHQMAGRYSQTPVSLQPSLDQLMLLRNEKETFLRRLESQIISIKSSLQESSQLMNQIQSSNTSPYRTATFQQSANNNHTARWSVNPNSMTAATNTAAPNTSSSFQQPHSGLGGNFSGSAGGGGNVSLGMAPTGGSSVVNIQGPSGMIVTTNSSILSNSPQRSRVL